MGVQLTAASVNLKERRRREWWRLCGGVKVDFGLVAELNAEFFAGEMGIGAGVGVGIDASVGLPIAEAMMASTRR